MSYLLVDNRVQACSPENDILINCMWACSFSLSHITLVLMFSIKKPDFEAHFHGVYELCNLKEIRDPLASSFLF